MRKVILEINENSVFLTDVPRDVPIFGALNGKIVGMLINDISGWVLRKPTGERIIESFNSRKDYIKHIQKFGYEFFVE